MGKRKGIFPVFLFHYGFVYSLCRERYCPAIHINIHTMMQSTIKVEFNSIFSNPKGDKEPMIRVDLLQSDDPRDHLINSIFSTGKLHIQKVDEGKDDHPVWVISSKNRHSHIYDLVSNVHDVMLKTVSPDETNIVLVTSHDEFYFDNSELGTGIKRSKGFKRDSLLSMADRDIIQLAVNDFKSFAKEHISESVFVRDNSTGFRKFLDEKGILWMPAEHCTQLPANTDLFALGQELQRYKDSIDKTP